MHTPSTVLIIPTLNEAQNINQLIQEFWEAYPNMHILVADSESPDGTAKKVQNRFGATGKVTVLTCSRTKGRGAAIVEAYQWILKNNTAQLVATADADFSHRPKDFPLLIAATQEADLIIGSRYVPGSRIKNWPRYRRIFSVAANKILERTLKVGIKDYTNGYRVFKKQLLKELDLKKLDANGFIMLSQELAQWHKQGRTIKEIPTVFVNRVRGKSHFSLRMVAESVKVLIKLYQESRHD